MEFCFFVGALASMGGPAGTHLSPLINGAYSRQGAERNAINTPVQGTAADLIKLAMVRVHRELRERRLKTKMVLQIHDELLFDVPREEADTVRTLVRNAMTTVLDIGVPLDVSIGVGDNWLVAH